MSDNKDDLQHALNMFNNYCLQWKLRVNTRKTKLVIFSKGRKQSNMKFTLQEKELEIVDQTGVRVLNTLHYGYIN